MSKPETISQQQLAARPGEAKPATETRIDSAHPSANISCHPLEDGAASEAQAEPNSAGQQEGEAGADEPESGRLLLQQIRGQAEQLGAYLRTRQEELDHREAQINARAAQIDHDARTARLWLSERDQELDRREEALGQREAELALRLERIAQADAALRKRAEEAQRVWTDRQRDRRQQDEEQIQRERGLQEREAALRQAREQWEADCQRAEDAITFQRQQLDAHRVATEQLVRDLHAAVERRRVAVEAEAERMETLARLRRATAPPNPPENTPPSPAVPPRGAVQPSVPEAIAAAAPAGELRGQRQVLEQEFGRQREAWAEEQRRAASLLESRRQAVEHRSRELDESESSLQRLQQELKALHREVLEDRLVAEQLWTGLAGAVPESILRHAQTDARARLANEMRDQRDLLARKRRELESLRSELLAQRDQILKQKQRFETWAARREQELLALSGH